MREINFRCSSLADIMTEPKTKAEGPLSRGAKTAIRNLAKQEIYGVEFTFSSKETQKGNEVEAESLALINRVRGLSLVKNTERRTLNGLTGEPDAVDLVRRVGHDVKSAWSLKTFNAFAEDCPDKTYEWQMRGYMALWDLDVWEVNYCMVETPEHLIGHEPIELHLVDHIPEHLRLTTWTIERDREIEARIFEKIEHAKAYYQECLLSFAKDHRTFKQLEAA